jgi:hypothetical protein
MPLERRETAKYPAKETPCFRRHSTSKMHLKINGAPELYTRDALVNTLCLSNVKLLKDKHSSSCKKSEVTCENALLLLTRKPPQNHADQDVQSLMFTLRTPEKLPRPSRVCISKKPPANRKMSL